MRWIFVSLMVANVLYFGWGWSQEVTVPEVEVRAVQPEVEGGDSSGLVLLSEVKQEKLVGLLEAKQRLKMVERDAEVDRPLCTLVGPFKALLKAEYFSERLQALDIVAAVEQVVVPGEKGFWVYQISELSRKAALRRLYEFQAKGIDSYIIPKGELENGISFGIFPTMGDAELRKKEIAALGFEVEIKSAERSYQEIWLVLQPEEASKAGEELWLELINPKDNVELVQNFCPTIASR